MVAIPLGVEAGDTEPHGAATQDTDHSTPMLAGSLLTVAVKFAVVPAKTVAAVSESETLIAESGVVDEPPPPQAVRKPLKK